MEGRLLKQCAYVLLSLAALSFGCIAPLTQEPLPTDHPANAEAASTPVPSPAPVLQADDEDSFKEFPAITEPAEDPAHEAAAATPDVPSPASPAAVDVYTCPMHPDVIRKEPGTCPKCGMKLVKQERP